MPTALGTVFGTVFGWILSCWSQFCARAIGRWPWPRENRAPSRSCSGDCGPRLACRRGLTGLAGVHVRTVNNLERGLVAKPRRDTVELLANALRLEGQALAEFEAASGRRLRDRAPAAAAGSVPEDGADVSGDPGRWLNRVVTALEQVGVSAARSELARWKSSTPVDDAWLTWADRLITLTAEGRMRRMADRPLPVVRADPLFGRDEQEGRAVPASSDG